MGSISSSTNAIVRSAEGRAAHCLMPRQSFRTKSFGGFVAPSTFPRGRKNLASVLISVPPAARPYPIRLGICLTSGFLLGSLKVVAGWKSSPTYVLHPKPLGTPLIFRERAMTSYQIFLTSSRFCTLPMPNNRFERDAPPASFACCLRAPQAARWASAAGAYDSWLCLSCSSQYHSSCMDHSSGSYVVNQYRRQTMGQFQLGEIIGDRPRLYTKL
jgi:hypothetical protein